MEALGFFFVLMIVPRGAGWDEILQKSEYKVPTAWFHFSFDFTNYNYWPIVAEN